MCASRGAASRAALLRAADAVRPALGLAAVDAVPVLRGHGPDAVALDVARLLARACVGPFTRRAHPTGQIEVRSRSSKGASPRLLDEMDGPLRAGAKRRTNGPSRASRALVAELVCLPQSHACRGVQYALIAPSIDSLQDRKPDLQTAGCTFCVVSHAVTTDAIYWLMRESSKHIAKKSQPWFGHKCFSSRRELAPCTCLPS